MGGILVDAQRLVGAGDDLALGRIVGHGIAREADLHGVVDGQHVSLDPGALADHHGGLAGAEGGNLARQVGLQGLVAAVLHAQVDEAEEVVVQHGIILDVGLTGLEGGDQRGGIVGGGVQEVLHHMLEHPPLGKAGGHGLIAGLGQLIAGGLKIVQGPGELQAHLVKDGLVVQHAEVVALQREAVNLAVAVHHHGRHGGVHRLGGGAAGEVVGILGVVSDLLAGGGAEDVGGRAGVDAALQQGGIVVLGGLVVDGDVGRDLLIGRDQLVYGVRVLGAGDEHVDLHGLVRHGGHDGQRQHRGDGQQHAQQLLHGSFSSLRYSVCRVLPVY